MKRSKFTEEQVIAILREQKAGAKTADVCRRHGIRSATFYAWKAKYGGMRGEAAAGARGREREAEASAGGRHARQYRAEGSAGKKMVTPAARRSAVAHLQKAYEMSERRACLVAGADQSMIRYRSRRADDAKVRERLHAPAAERRCFGYRRLRVLLRWKGLVMNRKRTERL